MAAVSAWGVDSLHLDVMDGVFVPNITFGPEIISQLRPLLKIPFDVHLMLQHPDRLLPAFLDAGADIVTIHMECSAPLRETLKAIRDREKRAALAVNPGTPVETVFPYLNYVDMVLIMSVQPGFGGQAFRPETLKKAAALRAEIDRRYLDVEIRMDGGIQEDNLSAVAAAGVDTVVMGSALFQSETPASLVRAAHEL